MPENSVIWITGASSGIGEALALGYAKENARLILSARRTEELERVKNACLKFTHQVEILPFDLAEINVLDNICDRALDLFGRIDIFIHSGGISQRETALNTNVDVEHRIMNINYFSAVHIVKKILPAMLQNGSGRLVLISSVTGKFGVPARSTYSASKHALIGYFDSLRAELTIAKQTGIHITIAIPGYIKTEISYNAVMGDGHQQGLLDKGQAGGMAVEDCAAKIMKAVKKKKREVLIGKKEIIMVYIRRFIPALYYKLITKVATK